MPLSNPSTPANTDGWIDGTSRTWVYASASTFTIAGVDLTSVFTKGTRLKWTQTTVKYGVVVSSSFSTDTTVTIAVNTDYTIANAAISANYYSYAANPQGYPGWFTYTTGAAGWSSTSTDFGKFSVVGTACTMMVRVVGTSNATSAAVNAPITNAGSAAALIAAASATAVTDSGTDSVGNSYFTSSTVLAFTKTIGGGNFTNSGTKAVQRIVTYEI